MSRCCVARKAEVRGTGQGRVSEGEMRVGRRRARMGCGEGAAWGSKIQRKKYEDICARCMGHALLGCIAI